MLNETVEQTNMYIDEMPKRERKKYGQFFTSKETALFMASLFQIPEDKNTIKVLDAGAGILSCALMEKLQENHNVKRVELTCYENDENILEILRKNLDCIKLKTKIDFDYRIITDNYITSQYLDFNELIGADINPVKYDIVIGNPPYMKIPKDAPEATAMPVVCYGIVRPNFGTDNKRCCGSGGVS